MSCARILAFVRNRLIAVAVDEAGNLLPMAASGLLVLVVLLALVGGGVDMSRVYKVQNRLQAACDAGALAGRKAVTTNGYDTAAQTQASTFFNVNFDKAQQSVTSVSFGSNSTDNGTTVVGTATANVPMLVMAVFGKTNIPVTTNCTATEGISNTDVTFVLDTTGSMDTILTGTQTRMDALKAAAKNFYTTLYNSSAGTTARVRYSFVPFSSGVNVGGLLYALNPNYLINNYTIQSRVARTEATVTGKFSGSTTNTFNISQEVYPTSGYNSTPAQVGSTSYASLSVCQAGVTSDTGWTSNGTATVVNTTNYTPGFIA